jgi:hypothetical protein
MEFLAFRWSRIGVKVLGKTDMANIESDLYIAAKRYSESETLPDDEVHTLILRAHLEIRMLKADLKVAKAKLEATNV